MYTGPFTQSFSGISGTTGNFASYSTTLQSVIPTDGSPITATASWTQDWSLPFSGYPATAFGEVGGGVLHRADLSVTATTGFSITGTMKNGSIYMWNSSYQNVITPVGGQYNDAVLTPNITGTLSPGSYKLFWDSAIGGGIAINGHRDGGYNLTFSVTSIDAGAVTSGSVTAATNQAVVVTNASGGVINATAGSAQVGTLAGATLNTGAAGATVTTLTSGIINTAGGSVTTEGGTFTGEITGNGGLTKIGTGTLVLNSANSFTGNTVINAGTVEIAVGDALGTGAAPIRIANNGRFKALAGVAVTKPVVISSGSAIYEHVLSGSDSVTNLAPVSNNVTTADIVAGDATATTVASTFNGDGSLTLNGLDGTRFLMVLDMDFLLPNDATTAEYYLGWWDDSANSGAGAWVNAVLGNHGQAGTLAGAYTSGYSQFLMNNGGWNGTTMLGAYGLDVARHQVWAVIDHNSSFGIASNGSLVQVVPEPSTIGYAIAGMVGGIWMLHGRRSRADRLKRS